MNHALSIAATVLIVLVLVEAAKYFCRLVWENRGKVPNLATVQVPAWSVLLVAVLVGGLVFAPRGCSLPVVPWPVVVSLPPFETDTLSVLVVEESKDRGKYTSDQLNAITATDAKSLKAKVEGKGGRFEVIDLDTQASLQNAAPWIAKAMAVKRDSLPWIVAATPKSGFSAALTTEADAISRVEALR